MRCAKKIFQNIYAEIDKHILRPSKVVAVGQIFETDLVTQTRPYCKNVILSLIPEFLELEGSDSLVERELKSKNLSA